MTWPYSEQDGTKTSGMVDKRSSNLGLSHAKVWRGWQCVVLVRVMPHLRDMIADLPVPAELASDYITRLLAKAIADPTSLLPREIKDIAISAAFHLISRT